MEHDPQCEGADDAKVLVDVGEYGWHVVRSLLCLLAVVSSVTSVAAEEWRGIVPLRSTRQDIVRLLGQCSATSDRCEFSLPSEDVFITFSGPNACPGVPPQTVLLIEREMKDGVTLAAPHLDKKRFKSFDPSWPRNIGYRGYLDERAGLILKAFKGEVFQIDYIAAKEDRVLCPSFYREVKRFVEAIAEHAPLVSIQCPKQNPIAGENLAFVADYIRSGLRIYLEWYASGGKILEGQGRSRMVLDTTGLEGQTIMVKVERTDTLYHSSVDSCTLQILAPRLKL